MIKRFKTVKKRDLVLGAAVLLVVSGLAFSEKRANAHEVSSDGSERGSLEEQIQSIHDLVLSLHGSDSHGDNEASRDEPHSEHEFGGIIDKHFGSDHSEAVVENVRKNVRVLDLNENVDHGKVLRLHLENLEHEGIDDGDYTIEIKDAEVLHLDGDRKRVVEIIKRQRAQEQKIRKNALILKREHADLDERESLSAMKQKARAEMVREKMARKVRTRATVEQAEAEIVALEKELAARKRDLEERVRMVEDSVADVER